MYCNNCGSELKDGSKFCPKCGEPVTPMETQKEETSGFPDDDAATFDPVSSRPMDDTNVPAQNRRPKWWIFVIIAAVIVVVIIAIVFGMRSSREIDLNDYVTVEFEGYEGYGTADVSFDWDALSSKYDQKIQLDQSGWGGFYDSFSELLDDCVAMHVDPKSELSNGDEVTVSWDVDSEDLNACINGTIKISADPKTYTVSGLEEGGTFDAFEGVSVEFSGTSPDATAYLVKSADVPSQLRYSLDQTEGLSFDDTVTVTISENSANAYMQESGLFPEELTKSFPVENVAYYVTSLDQISEDGMEKLKSQTEDVFKSVAAGWDSEERVLNSMDYLGSYFLTEKEGVDNNDINMIYMVYNIHVSQFGKEENGNPTEESVDYYWYLGFTNGMMLADGTFSIDYSEYITPKEYDDFIYEIGDGFSVMTYDYTKDMTWSREIDLEYTGFKDLDSMFNNVVTTRIDEYNYESTVGQEEETGNNVSSDDAEMQPDDVEDAVEHIQDVYYNEIQPNYESSYTKTDIRDGVVKYTSSDGTYAKCIIDSGTDGEDWTREYYYENGNLIFAFYFHGDDENRFYFSNGKMFRWIDENSETHDLEYDNNSWSSWEDTVLAGSKE